MGLSGERTDLRELLMLTPEELAAEHREAERDLELTRKAAAILRRGRPNAYDNALRVLRADSRDWWQDLVDDEEFPPTAEGLADFISIHLEPFCLNVEKQVRHCAVIRAQTVGEGLRPHRLEKLSRYETHLDRKFQRTLAMLIRLKELRSG
jgi:hypothetical protein